LKKTYYDFQKFKQHNCNNDNEKFLEHQIYILGLFVNVILNCNNISEYYCFYCSFD